MQEYLCRQDVRYAYKENLGYLAISTAMHY